MTRTTDSQSDRDPTLATTTATGANVTPRPAPTTAVPTENPVSVPPAEPIPVAAPSLAPDRSTIPGGVSRIDEAAPATLAPEASADVALDDPYLLDIGDSGSSGHGAGGLDLPDGPAVIDLPTTDVIDTGVDWNGIEGSGSIDGRGVDTFEGSTGAPGSADPDAMVSDGGLFGWLFGSDESATTESGAAPPKTSDGAGAEGVTGTDVSGVTTPDVRYSDDGVSSTVKEPTGEGAGWLKGAVDFFTGKKNIDGSPTEKQKQMDQIGPDTDGLPPDHPDYVGPPSDRPLGSATDASIEQSLAQGLGGDRGGDVDPFDDPQASPTGGEQLFDPYDSVIDPGPDGFTSNPDIDESYLPDATDTIDPYLADG